MCLVLFGIDAAPDLPFILLANRDEFLSRPTRPMGFWKNAPGILAGKDLEAGGTWMGVNTTGRFAALTNFRDPAQNRSNAPSRGEIIPALLSSCLSIENALATLARTASAYNGFNLVAGENNKVFWYSNQAKHIHPVPPGIHGVSNHLLNTPWPKVITGKKNLKTALEKNPWDDSTLLALLRDTTRPRDKDLPDTGVGLEWERILSPLFIQSRSYATRSSTLLRYTPEGRVEITERSYDIARDDPEHPPGFPPESQWQDRSFTLVPGG